MAQYPRSTYRGEIIFQENAWLGYRSGGGDALNGALTVEVSLQYCK